MNGTWRHRIVASYGLQFYTCSRCVGARKSEMMVQPKKSSKVRNTKHSKHLPYMYILRSFVSAEATPLTTVERCYGQQIQLQCEEDELVWIRSSSYRQTTSCPGRFYSNFCDRTEHNNPPCAGESSCEFAAPWEFIDRDCGYSNSFSVAYQCLHSACVQSQSVVQCSNPFSAIHCI